MKPQLLIFDLDGTLIDSRADLAASINYMRAHFALEPLSLATVSSYVGDGLRKLVERSLQGEDVNLDEALRISSGYYFSHLTVHTEPYEGVSDGLKRLKAAGHRLALLTNKPGDPSREIMRHFGFEELFCAIVGAGDAPGLKPEPSGVLQVLAEAETPLEKVWMIGDHCTDLAVAENAEIRSAFMTYGFGEERGHKVDQYFASFSELVEYFV